MSIDFNQPLYLIGGGGHCKVLVDVLHILGAKIGGYNDIVQVEWLESLTIPRISEEKLENLCKRGAQLVMAFIGTDVSTLKRRMEKMRMYESYGAILPKVIHPKAIISATATIKEGSQVLAGAVINPYSTVESGSIINTRGVVEHDVVVKSGSHIAPGAIVLGNATIGENCYIGASSIVIQGISVSNNAFIKAGQTYNG